MLDRPIRITIQCEIQTHLSLCRHLAALILPSRKILSINSDTRCWSRNYPPNHCQNRLRGADRVRITYQELYCLLVVTRFHQKSLRLKICSVGLCTRLRHSGYTFPCPRVLKYHYSCMRSITNCMVEAETPNSCYHAEMSMSWTSLAGVGLQRRR